MKAVSGPTVEDDANHRSRNVIECDAEFQSLHNGNSSGRSKNEVCEEIQDFEDEEHDVVQVSSDEIESIPSDKDGHIEEPKHTRTVEQTSQTPEESSLEERGHEISVSPEQKKLSHLRRSLYEFQVQFSASGSTFFGSPALGRHLAAFLNSPMLTPPLPKSKRNQVKASGSPECPICFEAMSELPLSVTKCGHVFHEKCLERSMIHFKASCPSCRSDINEERVHKLRSAPGPARLNLTSESRISSDALSRATKPIFCALSSALFLTSNKVREIRNVESKLNELRSESLKLRLVKAEKKKTHEKEIMSITTEISNVSRESDEIKRKHKMLVDHVQESRELLLAREELIVELQEEKRNLQEQEKSAFQRREILAGTGSKSYSASLRELKCTLDRLLSEEKALEQQLKSGHLLEAESAKPSAVFAKRDLTTPNPLALSTDNQYQSAQTSLRMSGRHSAAPPSRKRNSLAETMSLPKAPVARNLPSEPGERARKFRVLPRASRKSVQSTMVEASTVTTTTTTTTTNTTTTFPPSYGQQQLQLSATHTAAGEPLPPASPQAKRKKKTALNEQQQKIIIQQQAEADRRKPYQASLSKFFTVN